MTSVGNMVIAIDDHYRTYDEIFEMAQPAVKIEGFRWVLKDGWWAWTKNGGTLLARVVREEHTTQAAMDAINAYLAKEVL